MDERGEKIGKLHRVIISLGHKIEVRELDDTILFEIHKKIISVRQTYDIKDAEGNMLGRIKKALMAIVCPKLTLEDAEGKAILDCKGKPMKWDFTVIDPQGKLVATIGKLDKWRDVFLKGVFNFKDKYALHLNDEFAGKIDLRLLLGYVLAIDNIFHEKK